MLKKPSIILSCNPFHLQVQQAQSFPSISKTSSCYQSRRREACRPYAMVADGHCKHDHGSLRWPEMTSVNKIPTPYQIFDQKKGSAYSKQRFYELVKMYHPDRHDLETSTSGLSYAVKMERYRLVVAANEILSDPVKRSAFDRYGAGWNGMPGVRTAREGSNSTAPWSSYNGGGWRDPDGPSQNATWEDWERWYDRDNKQKQEPQFVSNGAFVGLIVMFAIIGGVGQATRAEKYSLTFIEQRDALHKNLSKDLKRRRHEATSLWGTREERVNNFLKQRAPVGYDDSMEIGHGERRLLPPPEMCSSENIKKQPLDMSKHFNNVKDG